MFILIQYWYEMQISSQDMAILFGPKRMPFPAKELSKSKKAT